MKGKNNRITFSLSAGGHFYEERHFKFDGNGCAVPALIRINDIWTGVDRGRVSYQRFDSDIRNGETKD